MFRLVIENETTATSEESQVRQDPRQAKADRQLRKAELSANREAKAKIMVAALRGKYPTREEVGVASGHLPTPAYLKRFKLGNGRCLCGTDDADWMHLAQCPRYEVIEHGEDLRGLAKSEAFAAFSYEIWRRGREVCGSRFQHSTRDPKTIILKDVGKG